jgi:signal transduction histidine kinase
VNELQALDLLPEAVVVVSGDGTVLHTNRMAARLLDGELAGRPATDVLPLRTEAGEDWWACARPLEGDARLLARIPEVDLELSLDGGQQPVILTAAREADSDGSLRRLIVCLRRAESRRRLDAARSDLVSTVSHEIRSPLTSVKGFTKTLLAKWDRFTDDQKRQMLATVNEDADRVTRLLSELLDVSRIDAGRLRLRRQMINVPDVARRIVERLSVGPHGDRLKLEFPDDIPALYADPDKIEQVFTNLLENALRHGGGMVTVTAEASPDEVCFTVQDEGGGIDPEHLSSVFMKFFGRSGERQSGTGLGLYITKGLIDAHGGRIWAESEPGAGRRSTSPCPRAGWSSPGWRCRLPCGPERSPHDRARPRGRPRGGPAPARRREHA